VAGGDVVRGWLVVGGVGIGGAGVVCEWFVGVGVAGVRGVEVGVVGIGGVGVRDAGNIGVGGIVGILRRTVVRGAKFTGGKGVDADAELAAGARWLVLLLRTRVGSGVGFGGRSRDVGFDEVKKLGIYAVIAVVVGEVVFGAGGRGVVGTLAAGGVDAFLFGGEVFGLGEADDLKGTEAGFGTYGEVRFFAGGLGTEGEFRKGIVFPETQESLTGFGDDVGLHFALRGTGEAGGGVGRGGVAEEA
jgi:hypothetical protein